MKLLVATSLSLATLVGACDFCQLEGDDTLINTLGLNPTPLPGNYFTLDKYDDGLITADQYPFANEQWYTHFVTSTTFPAVVHVQNLRQAGVEEILHFLPGNAIWSYNGGCTSKFLVIRRDLSYDWLDLGPNITAGEVHSVFIGAGEYYAHFNGPDGSAFMMATISPGINNGTDIIYPWWNDTVDDLGVQGGSALFDLIKDNGAAKSEANV